MYYIFTDTEGERVLAQTILFKKGYSWAMGGHGVKTAGALKAICIGTKSPGSLTGLHYTPGRIREYMRGKYSGKAQEINMSELNNLERV